MSPEALIFPISHLLKDLSHSALAAASRWHTVQLYGVIMKVVKIFRKQYDKLKQTNMRFLKRNTGEVAVQLDELVEKYKNKLGNKSYGEIQNKLGNKSW